MFKKINLLNEVKNFNWRMYGIKVAVVWSILMLFFGFVSGFKGYAQESIWISLGQTEESEIYALRGGMKINSQGNILITIKVEFKDFEGVIYSEWEFDCKAKLVRLYKNGDSLSNMIKVESNWAIPAQGSVAQTFFKSICSIGGN